MTASVAGSALAPVWPTAQEYSGGAALPPPRGFAAVPEEEYFRFLRRLEEPPEQFANRIISLEGISFKAADPSEETAAED